MYIHKYIYIYIALGELPPFHRGALRIPRIWAPRAIVGVADVEVVGRQRPAEVEVSQVKVLQSGGNLLIW